MLHVDSKWTRCHLRLLGILRWRGQLYKLALLTTLLGWTNGELKRAFLDHTSYW